ncbi:Flavodoxin-like domain-containing protein [Entamoeba marina]
MKQVAMKFARATSADIYEITTISKQKSAFLFTQGIFGLDVSLTKNPIHLELYKEVFVIGETYGFHCVSPVRTFLKQNKKYLKNNRTLKLHYVVCGKQQQRCLKDMKQFCGETTSEICVGKNELKTFNVYKKLQNVPSTSPLIVSDEN